MRGDGIAAKLVSIAQKVTTMRVVIVLSLIMCFCALVLGVTLYAMTRDQDRDLALLAFTCRAGEGVAGAVFLVPTLGLLWLATRDDGNASGAVGALGEFLLRVQDWSPLICATLFAVGSALFSWLLLRGRIIPIPLAWLGIFASVILVIGIPLRLAGLFRDPIFMIIWLPMLVFEVPLGVWLLIKGGRWPTGA
ncbi:MAG TPA: DUF4386 domain-containing protein, partial [Pyrinomonadaceae bacterium]